jgi:hypothetical protein
MLHNEARSQDGSVGVMSRHQLIHVVWFPVQASDFSILQCVHISREAYPPYSIQWVSGDFSSGGKADGK